jgi:hypothetical protein
LAKVPPRLLRDDFQVHNALPFEKVRSDVSPEIIRLHFQKFVQSDFCSISPHFIFNLDEMRVAASKSCQSQSRKLIVSNTFPRSPVFKGKTDSHFVIALWAMPAAGNVLSAALITTHETGQLHCDPCGYIPNARRYLTPKTLVTSQVFSDYLPIVISPDMAKLRESIDPNASALFRFDGHGFYIRDQ